MIYAINCAETYTDSIFGYSVNFPDNWVRESTDSTHHIFIDTTGTYTSIIAIERESFSVDTIYADAEEWTRAHFIAYAFVVDADPFSAISFYDTVTSRQTATVWSADAYTIFYDPEVPAVDIAEYIRYTAAGKYGYEIYAIGTLEDMNTNVGVYAALVQGFSILQMSGAVHKPLPSCKAMARSVYSPPHRFDLLGRMEAPGYIRGATGINVAPNSSSCTFR